MTITYVRFDTGRVSRRWWYLLDAARKAGIKFHLNSGHRTMAEQTALYRQNMLRPGVPRPGHPMTAVPSPTAPHIRTGRADHAIDVTDENLFQPGGGFERLQDWAGNHGVTIRRTVLTEAWHGEASGKDLRVFANKEKAARRVAAQEAKHLANVAVIARARRNGARFAWTIWGQAGRHGLPFSLALALVEQESNFRNVFGHDPTIFAGAGTVTKAKYLAYKSQRGPHGKGGMQGVGPCQLTWFAFQDQADLLGGCWVPKHNINVGFGLLVALRKQHGERTGLAIYNAGETHPNFQYADQVLARRAHWKQRLS